MRSTHTPKPRRRQYTLPHELWSRIFSYLHPTTPLSFSQVCKLFQAVSEDPHARAEFFIVKYGLQLAFYEAFRSHRKVLSVEVAKLLRKKGGGLPRFLVQWVDKEYHRIDRARKPVSIPLYVFFIQEGYQVYGMEADFKDDDVARFERLLYTGATISANPPPTLPETIESIKILLDKYAFVPVRGLGSPIDETVFLLSKLDVTLIPKLISNGLDVAAVNDNVLERVLWRADITQEFLQEYLDNGFKLTHTAIKKGLQIARPATLEVLRSRVPEAELAECAKDAIVDMFGPAVGRGWNWVPESVEFLIETFNITENVIARALYTHPNAPRLPNGGRADFPATRGYMKSNPCPVWRWVLKTYGPHHEFTQACFDDAISRAAAERDLHLLHDEFLQAGVRFYPRHVKILACRLLHRDMTANALHLLQTLREQVIDDRDAGVMTDHERGEWLRCFREEVTENDEWQNRMRTTQLEGGARGGAYRITRPPEDAIKFLDEAKDIVEELLPAVWGVRAVGEWAVDSTGGTIIWRSGSGEGRRRVQRSSSVKGWVKKMGVWWKEQSERGFWGVVENVV